jgi:hypothetical protein
MEGTIMRIFHLLACAVAVLLITLTFQTAAFARGRIEFHQMESKILADAGQPADKEVCVYLPDGYDVSGLAYPVEYLLHGGSDKSSREYWFGSGTHVIDAFVSRNDGLPNHRIIVMPSMGKTIRIDTLEWAHLVEEVIPLVEGMYRIIAYRERRAISGFSRGGVDALYIALLHPELFSVVAAISAAGMRPIPWLQLEDMISNLYPLQFWVAYGQNEDWVVIAPNHMFISRLDQLGIPYICIEDDGIHADWVRKGRRDACEKFISETLGGGVTFIETQGKLPATWGIIKRSR